MTHFCLHDEQTVNGLRKITWASNFHFLFETAANISSSVFGLGHGHWKLMKVLTVMELRVSQ
jgi:hypothetical protein